MDNCLDSVSDVAVITVAHVMSAFWQLPVAKGDVDKTAFITPSDKYVFLRIPLAVMSAAWLFQRIICYPSSHGSRSRALVLYQ